MNRFAVYLVPLLALAPFAAQADPIICGTTQGVTCLWDNNDEPIGQPSEQVGDPVMFDFFPGIASALFYGSATVEFAFTTPINGFSFDYNELLTKSGGVAAPPQTQAGPHVLFYSGDNLVFNRYVPPLPADNPDPYNGSAFVFDFTSVTPFDQVYIMLFNGFNTDGFQMTNIDPPGSVPEPGAAALLGVGILGLAGLRLAGHRKEAGVMKLICQECAGYGSYKEVITDAGEGPTYECGWCEGTGVITPENRGLWLAYRRATKKEAG